jgi:hypothetical protein
LAVAALAAGADALVLLESGALVGPEWLDRLLAALAADPRNGLAGPSMNAAWNDQAIFPRASATPRQQHGASRRARRGTRTSSAPCGCAPSAPSTSHTAGQRPWVAGNTLCYRKAFWRINPFPDLNVGEDTRFQWTARPKHIQTLPDERFFVALIHPYNTSPKRTHDGRWQAQNVAARSRHSLGVLCRVSRSHGAIAAGRERLLTRQLDLRRSHSHDSS